MGSAARAGLRPGQVIVGVHDELVVNLDELARLLTQDRLTEGVRLVVRTAQGDRFAFLRVPK